MTNPLRLIAQAVAYALFAFVLGYLSWWPRYLYSSPDIAVVKVSVRHATDRVKPCVILTPDEIAKLPPNMRQPQKCERERLPLTLELDVDGETALAVQAPPSGLWGDGPASIYKRFELPPGTYRITARMRATARPEGWDYTHIEDVQVEAGRYLTITFAGDHGGFNFR